ncbi:MAG: MAPEG family protein [Pseudomonadaceae bacterium]|nr:MAPEG family protein [Pseudomonadaceae bacterium]
MIVAIYAALLALLFVALSVHAIRTRRRLQIAVGDGEQPLMLRAMRVHANFAEYTPIALIVIAAAEISGAADGLVHGLGIALLVGRCLHAFGVAQLNEDFRLRVSGMMLTLAVLIVASLTALWLSLAGSTGASQVSSEHGSQQLEDNTVAAEERLENSYNFRPASDRVSTSGIVPAEALARLSDEGVAAVINLLPSDSEHAVENEADLVTSQGLTYVHLPVDWNEPTAADFERFSDAMNELAGKRIHVHCAANFRVSGFYSVWAEQQGLWNRSQANDFIADVWDPTEHPQWAELLTSLRQEL